MGIVIGIIAILIILFNLSFFLGVIRWIIITTVIALILFNYDSHFVQEVLPIVAFIILMISLFYTIPGMVKKYGGYKLAYQYLLVKFRPAFTDDELISKSRKITEMKDIVDTTKEKKLLAYYENSFKEISADFIEFENHITKLLDTYIKQGFAKITLKKPKYEKFMEHIECSTYSFQVCSLVVRSKNKENILDITIEFNRVYDEGYAYKREDSLIFDEDNQYIDSRSIKDISKQAKKCFIKYVKKNPQEFL